MKAKIHAPLRANIRETSLVPLINGIEDGLLPVMEASLPQFNRSKNLHGLALPGHGNFRRTTDPAPGGVQGRILAKAGFVGEDQHPVCCCAFF